LAGRILARAIRQLDLIRRQRPARLAGASNLFAHFDPVWCRGGGRRKFVGRGVAVKNRRTPRPDDPRFFARLPPSWMRSAGAGAARTGGADGGIAVKRWSGPRKAGRGMPARVALRVGMFQIKSAGSVRSVER